jgi:Ca2+-binding RTX toxin-like protein
MFGAWKKRTHQSRWRWLLAPAVGVIATGSLLASAVPAQSAPKSTSAMTSASTRGGGTIVDLSTGEPVTTPDAGSAAVSCTITGTAHADVLHGTAGDDVICGLGGSDVLVGDEGNDLLVGGRGNDHLEGGPGDDMLRGNNGDDYLGGGPGDDALNGGPDMDRCVGAADVDTATNCEKVNGVP